jgi:hypothetical protein
MLFLLCLYYVIMETPLGMVDTSLQNGILQVGDRIHHIPPKHKLTSVRKNNGFLFFKFSKTITTQRAALSPSF